MSNPNDMLSTESILNRATESPDELLKLSDEQENSNVDIVERLLNMLLKGDVLSPEMARVLSRHREFLKEVTVLIARQVDTREEALNDYKRSLEMLNKEAELLDNDILELSATEDTTLLKDFALITAKNAERATTEINRLMDRSQGLPPHIRKLLDMLGGSGIDVEVLRLPKDSDDDDDDDDE